MSAASADAVASLTTSGRWLAMAASRAGSAHSPDEPNQDAVLVRPLAGGGLVAAVADGHGGTRYTRSDVGARIAVEVAVDVLGSVVDPDPGIDLDLRALMPVVVNRWLRRVGQHAASRPLDGSEIRAGADSSSPITAYGSTLLVTAVRGGRVRLAQLGDGDVLVLASGVPRRPVPGDHRLAGGRTTSLSLPEAASDVRFAEVAEDDCDLVLLATDGLGNSFAQADWWSLLVEDCLALARHHGPQHLAARLPDWLAESARVGGDDVTAAVLLRQELPPGKPLHEATDPERSAR